MSAAATALAARSAMAQSPGTRRRRGALSRGAVAARALAHAGVAAAARPHPRPGAPAMADAPRYFDKNAPDRSPAHGRIYAFHEVLRTVVDFGAALCFLVGSVLFFWEATQVTATWLFVIGSVFFMLKPTLRLVRELQYVRQGRYAPLAEEAAEEMP